MPADGILVGISTVAGAASLKILEYFLKRSEERSARQDAVFTELRNQINELKTTIEELKEQVRGAENDVDEWRNKYYAVMPQMLELEGKIRQLMFDLDRAKDK